MARYTLIIRDETYAKLLLLAAKEKKTLGRYLNDLLDSFVEQALKDGESEKETITTSS